MLLQFWIELILWWASLPLGVYAFGHAAMQRADAFTAADKLSKPAWLGITGGGMLVLGLSQGPGGGMIFWVAGLVAVLVYLVDVRPKVTEVQRGSSW
ncbi:DUF2516 family protein [Haloactinomyces albus]|uniref:DUF2516 family protein n=1 Tax=Haloactinomyces albus TaxID=1352928 RepID=A0AAE4CQ58_9ACTN|nr:DUF2516 family protein [Haloactinomyces albus]MDR7302323.1 hypothetical protein [Haloactinomyces albus]